MDLLEAFNCIPHRILIVTLHIYGISKSNLMLFYPYLKRRKQNVKLNKTYSLIKELLSASLVKHN